MNNDLTLVIPAKNEKESLPFVINELNKVKINFDIVFVVEKSDIDTINIIKKFKKKIIFQTSKGYGDALITGVKNIKTKFFCIFNADGSFNPNELDKMLSRIRSNNHDFIFATRYEKGCSSEDDTIITKIGNFIFTKIGNIFFKLRITDILYTFVIGKTQSFKKLNLKEKDFRLCVELPITAKKFDMLMCTSPSNERKRFSGKKKVNAFKDGFLILSYMIKKIF